MDQYGTCRATAEDWNMIADLLKQKGIVNFSYSADNYTAFVITIAGPLAFTGVPSFGGRVKGSYLASILMRGASYFDFFNDTFLHPDYIEEKLNLRGADSKVISELLNEIKRRVSS